MSLYVKNIFSVTLSFLALYNKTFSYSSAQFNIFSVSRMFLKHSKYNKFEK